MLRFRRFLFKLNVWIAFRLGRTLQWLRPASGYTMSSTGWKEVSDLVDRIDDTPPWGSSR